jgi:hypothetical protein
MDEKKQREQEFLLMEQKRQELNEETEILCVTIEIPISQTISQ